MTALTPRTVVRLDGRVVAIQVEPQEGACQMIARIECPEGMVDAVFMGRRLVPGIEPGTRLRCEGMVAEHEGSLRIFNPRYELI